MDASWIQQFPVKTRFGTLRETLSKKDWQRSAIKPLSARFWEATVSTCVPKGSQMSSQVASCFAFFCFIFCNEGLLGPQAHPRATRRTQNVVSGATKSTAGGQKAAPAGAKIQPSSNQLRHPEAKSAKNSASPHSTQISKNIEVRRFRVSVPNSSSNSNSMPIRCWL